MQNIVKLGRAAEPVSQGAGDMGVRLVTSATLRSNTGLHETLSQKQNSSQLAKTLSDHRSGVEWLLVRWHSGCKDLPLSPNPRPAVGALVSPVLPWSPDFVSATFLVLLGGGRPLAPPEFPRVRGHSVRSRC